MIFLVLLLTIGGIKLFGWHVKPQHDQWFFSFSERVSSALDASPRLAMLVILLVPLAVTGVIVSATRDWLFGLVGVFLHVLILFYALGRVNLHDQLRDYLSHWRKEDYQSAYYHAQQQFNDELEFSVADTNSLHQNYCRGLLYQWFEQVFVIVFWYLLLGPLGALFMRLLSLYGQSREGGNSLQLLHVLEWLPVRSLALIYAVAGNFSHCAGALVAVITDVKVSTRALLLKTGLAAVGSDDAETYNLSAEQQAQQLEALQGLQVRSLIVCMILAALLTIF